MNSYDYFFEHSHKVLDKDFILGTSERISYRQLVENSLKVATAIQASVGKHQNILLISSNSLFFVTAYLAILKSGNVAVPLNPEIEQSNLNLIIEKCIPGIIIIQRRLIEKYDVSGVMIWDEKLLNDLPVNKVLEFELNPDCDPNEVAEIIFTSGSTGEPKGVMITHRNLIANTDSILQYLRLTEDDIMLVVLPFYYCYGLSLLHTHLRIGGSIVFNNMFIMTGGVIRDLLKYNCTGFAGVPSHFQILLRKSASFRSTAFPHLRYVTQAGGKLHTTFITEFIAIFPRIQFHVMYGQTEATARLAWLPPEKLSEKLGSCGHAIPGVELRVADDAGNAVEPGEIGEVLARGENIMAGYYKDTEASQHTLIEGWLHTGDLATVDSDGYIYLTARKKEIIKVGGHRISPKEVEEVIVKMPEVIDCRIESIDDPLLGETIKAVVFLNTSENSKDITQEKVKKWCSERLSTFKVPQVVELKFEIGISATGKITRKTTPLSG
jgi:long-chain acyl-CoA synthetase